MRETEPDVPIENSPAGDLQLLVPNLHRRYSGVTATNRMVAPKLARMFLAAWLGPDAPAGIVRMNYWKFSAFTLLGSGIWCSVLCYVGVKMGQDENLMQGKLHSITIWLGGAMLVLGGLYYLFVHRHLKKKS